MYVKHHLDLNAYFSLTDHLAKRADVMNSIMPSESCMFVFQYWGYNSYRTDPSDYEFYHFWLWVYYSKQLTSLNRGKIDYRYVWTKSCRKCVIINLTYFITLWHLNSYIEPSYFRTYQSTVSMKRELKKEQNFEIWLFLTELPPIDYVWLCCIGGQWLIVRLATSRMLSNSSCNVYIDNM